LQNDDPDLWRVITGLPDGIRAPRVAKVGPPEDAEE
ncbi:unnamed protein product, partial [marine sediment metagenome]